MGGLAFTPRSVEEFAASGYELIAARSGPDQLHRRADELADPLDIVAAALGQIIPAACGTDVSLPTRHLFVDRLAVLVVRDVRDRMVVALTAEVVAGADLELGLLVEDVQTHESRAADAIYAHGVARDGGVEPADAPWSSSHGAELVTALADLVPHLVQQLRRKRSVTDPRGVRLEHSDRKVDLGWRDAAAGERAARGGIGAGYVWIGSEVKVGHRRLGAFQQDVGAAL